MTKSVFTQEYRLFLQELIRMRKTQNFTQNALAKKLKKPQSYVSKFESGERRLDVIETRDILLALNVPLIHFFKVLEKKLK